MKGFCWFRILSVLITILFGLWVMSVWGNAEGWNGLVQGFEGDSIIEFREGDILARPNSSWLPGSCYVPDGRMYGHVAIVTKGATGKTIEEVLEKSMVVEACFFDQFTRRFQFHKKDQIREASAAMSFGPRFKGIRYLLRLKTDSLQIKTLHQFLFSQLDGGYNILSTKQRIACEFPTVPEKFKSYSYSWHCATLAWEAFYLSCGIDIDNNKGILIYPSDIICCPLFDKLGCRKRF